MPDRACALHITRNLPPLQGGMERLNGRIAQALTERFRVAVVGPTGCRAALPEDCLVTETPLRPLPLFLVRAGLSALRLALRHRPRLVLAGSGLTAPLAWIAACVSGSRSVVYVHGLDLVVDSTPYRLFWLPFIRRMDLVLVNSANTGRLAVGAGVVPGRVRILHPGTELPQPAPDAALMFRRDHALGERPVLLSVGRLTARKGLREFVARCLPDLLQQRPELLLLVIGADALDALTGAAGSERARIEQAAEAAGVASALRFLPPCDDVELSAAYAACDMHVFPVRELPGDVEGFGMVAVEAAAHGLITVGFRSGGVPDAVIEDVTGQLVEADDHAALAAAIDHWLPLVRHKAVRERCRAASSRWSWGNFAASLHASVAETLAA